MKKPLQLSETPARVITYPASKEERYDVSGLGEGIFFIIIEVNDRRKYTGKIVIKSQIVRSSYFCSRSARFITSF
ncbi:MAG: hypothetical protein OXH57_03240 [Ekhidna sp.]|nr:hypothetical protein [Ekhidna sp.]